MSSRQSSFIVDNASDGFSLHDTETGNIVRSFSTKPTKPYPKQVSLAERGTLVVGGGDQGKVHIFEKRTGGEFQVLHHSQGGLVQAIAVRDRANRGLTVLIDSQTHDGEERMTIAAATSVSCADVSISVWRRKNKKNGNSSMALSMAMILLFGLIVAVSTIVLYDLMVSRSFFGVTSCRLATLAPPNCARIYCLQRRAPARSPRVGKGVRSGERALVKLCNRNQRIDSASLE